MSQRKGWLPSLFSTIGVAFIIMILMVISVFFIRISSTEVTYRLRVVMDIADSGRNTVILMNSQNSTVGINNLELLGNSLAANFEEDLLGYVIGDLEILKESYFGIGERTLLGTRPDKVFETEIPVPGGGKSGQFKTRVSVE